MYLRNKPNMFRGVWKILKMVGVGEFGGMVVGVGL